MRLCIVPEALMVYLVVSPECAGFVGQGMIVLGGGGPTTKVSCFFSGLYRGGQADALSYVLLTQHRRRIFQFSVTNDVEDRAVQAHPELAFPRFFSVAETDSVPTRYTSRFPLVVC